MKPLNKLIWIVSFALAMGFLETSVVIYLRAIYYPGGFSFPLRPMAQSLAVTELYREAATMIMLLAVSTLAAKQWLHRFAWFLLVFAIWDIAYYVFLKILIGWPETLFTMDILFLIPSLWTGPVLAPVVNSLTMILLATVILYDRKGTVSATRLSVLIWVLLITGSLIILYAYMKDYAVYVADYKHSVLKSEISLNEFFAVLPARFIPGSFDWGLFCTGALMHLIAVFLVVKGKCVAHS